MGKFIEIIVAAVVGSVLTIAAAMFTFGGWKSTVDLRLDGLDSRSPDNPGRVTSLEDNPAKLSAFPIGAIIPWIPKDPSSDQLLPTPAGWKICGSDGITPELSGSFLMGQSVPSKAGKRGGAEQMEPGSHEHSKTHAFKTTTVPRRCGGDCTVTGAQSSQVVSVEHGEHSHGSNLPPFYSVVFLCKS